MNDEKRNVAPTLSAYLLEEAQKFLLYPQRVRRTATGRKTIEMFDGMAAVHRMA
jgi:hypothetical protein